MKKITINGTITNMKENLEIKNIEKLNEYSFIVEEYTIKDYNDFEKIVTFDISSTREIELMQLENNYYIFINIFNTGYENIVDKYYKSIQKYIRNMDTLDSNYIFNNIEYYEKLFYNNGIMIVNKQEETFSTIDEIKKYQQNQIVINSYEFGAGSGFEIIYSFITGITVNIVYDLLKLVYYKIFKNKDCEHTIDILKVNKRKMKKVLNFIKQQYGEKFYKDLVLIKMKQTKNEIYLVWSYKGIKELEIKCTKQKIQANLKDRFEK